MEIFRTCDHGTQPAESAIRVALATLVGLAEQGYSRRQERRSVSYGRNRCGEGSGGTTAGQGPFTGMVGIGVLRVPAVRLYRAR